MTPNLRQIACYQAANQECAVIVLGNPENFGGEESLTVMWARAVENLRDQLGLKGRYTPEMGEYLKTKVF